jgi:hypothetical protein
VAVTPRFGATVLTGTETPDVARDYNQLTGRLEAVGALFAQGTFASRPAAATSNAGTFYRATDQGRSGIGVVYFSTGSAWVIPEPWVRPVSNLTSPGFSPAAGDEVDFSFFWDDQHSWRLRYTLRNARKWLGGYQLALSETNDSKAMTGSSFTFSAWNTATGTLQVPLPAPGRYRIDFGAYVIRTNSNLTARPAVSARISNVATNGIYRAEASQDALFLLNPAQDVNLSGSFVIAVPDDSPLYASLYTQLLSDGGGAVTFSKPRLSVTPLELGT